MAMMMNPPLSPGGNKSSSRPPSRGRNTNRGGGGRFLTRTRSPSPVPFIHQPQQQLPHNSATNTTSNSSATKIRGRSSHRRTNSTDSSASTNLNNLAAKHQSTNKSSSNMTSKEMELLKKKFPTLVAQMEKDAAVSNSATENYFDYYSGVPMNNGTPVSAAVGTNGYRAANNTTTPSNGGGGGGNTQYRNLTSKFSYDEAERMSNVSTSSKKSSTIRSMSPARMLSRLHKDSNKNHGGGKAHKRVGSGGSGNSGGATPGRASSVKRGAQQQQNSPQIRNGNEENALPVMITHTTSTPTRRSSPSPARRSSSRQRQHNNNNNNNISPSPAKKSEHQRDHSWGASSQFSSSGNEGSRSHHHKRSNSGSSGGRNVYIGPTPNNNSNNSNNKRAASPQFEFADDIRPSSRPSSRSNSRQRTQQNLQQQPYPLVPTISNQSSTFQGDNFFSSSNSVYGDGSTTFGGSSIGDYSRDGDSQILFDVLNDDSGGYFADGVVVGGKGSGSGGVDDDDLEKIIGGYVGSGKKKKNKMKEEKEGQQQARDSKKLYDMVKGVSPKPPTTSVPIWNEQYGDDTDDSLTDDDYGENNNGGEGSNTKNKNKISVVSPDKHVKKKGDNKVDGGSAEEDMASSPTSISSLFNCGGFGAADISETLRQLFSSFTGGDVQGGGGGANVVEDTMADEEERELMERLERVREKKRRGGGGVHGGGGGSSSRPTSHPGMDKVRARLQHSN